MELTHSYIPNTDGVKEEMLKNIGAESIEDLFSDVPDKFRFSGDLDIPEMTELEFKRLFKGLTSKNSPYGEAISFLGGGVWPHHVPSHVRSVVHRSEFATSYTPYQPEVSQGTLQALFEYQSLIAELTGLGAVNSSVYDWASAIGEAALMCSRLTGRDKFIVPELMSPERLEVLRSYTVGPRMEIKRVPQDEETGQMDLSELEDSLDGDTAGVYLETPNYLGHLETEPGAMSELSRREGSLFVVGVNPVSLGLLEPPADYGADIVVGEGQPLGNPVNFGGPSLGLFACREDRRFLRQMPGRLVGMAETEEGNERGFSMVLQTREQHIRRKKATSNLCTNQTLNAIAAAVYLSSLGSAGLQQVAAKCVKNANYAMKRFEEVEGLHSPKFDSPHFNEFVVDFNGSSATVDEINSKLLSRGIHGGMALSGDFPEFGETSLWCFTELHTEEDIDWMIESVKGILEGS